MSPTNLLTLDFEGDQNLRTVLASRDRLLGAFASGDKVAIRISDTLVPDLSFVQLLESARKTADAQGGSLALEAPARGALRETLERGGFLDAQDPDRRRFWLHDQGAA